MCGEKMYTPRHGHYQNTINAVRTLSFAVFMPSVEIDTGKDALSRITPFERSLFSVFVKTGEIHTFSNPGRAEHGTETT